MTTNELTITRRLSADPTLTENNDAVKRVLGFIQAITYLTKDDITQLDKVISDREEQLQSLRIARRLVASILTEADTNPPVTVIKPTDVATELQLEAPEDSETALKYLPFRERIVNYLKNGPKRSKDIIVNCQVIPRIINDVLDHPWFSQSSQGVHITPEARRAVLDS